MHRLLLAALVLTVAGCGGATPKPGVSAAPSAARAVAPPTAAPSPASPADPRGQKACDDTKAALAAGGLLDPLTMLRVATAAAQSGDDQIRQSAILLGRAAERAGLAKGQSDEAAMGATLAAKAMDFRGVCIDRGYGA